jgi:hypothetical protein
VSSDAIGIILVILLILLLIARGALQAFDTPRVQALDRILLFAIIPLLIMFGVVVLLRVIGWLN